MKIDILGVQVNADTKNTILFLIKKLLAEGQKIFIVTPYSEMVVRAQRDRVFRDILNSAAFALPDGIGILWAAHFLKFSPPARGGDEEGVGVRGKTIAKIWKLITSLLRIIFNPAAIRDPISEKISGSDFVWDLAKLAVDSGYSVFLLGGFDDTPELAAGKLKSKFPNLKIAGTTSSVILRYSEGSRDSSENTPQNDKLIEQINNSHADFLFVALGPVAQEKWIAENLDKLSIKLAIGLGGTFDYLAMKKPLAPQIWRRMGLEWLWRLLTQPWRILRISKGVLGLIWYTCISSHTSCTL